MIIIIVSIVLSGVNTATIANLISINLTLKLMWQKITLLETWNVNINFVIETKVHFI